MPGGGGGSDDNDDDGDKAWFNPDWKSLTFSVMVSDLVVVLQQQQVKKFHIEKKNGSVNPISFLWYIKPSTQKKIRDFARSSFCVWQRDMAYVYIIIIHGCKNHRKKCHKFWGSVFISLFVWFHVHFWDGHHQPATRLLSILNTNQKI